MHRFLVLGISRHNRVISRYWLIREASLFPVRAELYRDHFVARVIVIDLEEAAERKAS